MVVELDSILDLDIVSDEEELRNYFNERLVDLDYNEAVKTYVSNLMTDFVYDRGNNLMSVLFSEDLESVRINEFYQNKDFISLKDMGDTFLWICGFFPEHVIDKKRNKPRFLLTFEDYIQYGKTAYHHASTLFRDEKVPVGEISKRFEWIAHSILNMRQRINPSLRYWMHEETVEKIEEVLNDGEPVFRENTIFTSITN